MSNSYGSFKNFWYYNKKKIFALILALALIIFGITQCNFSSDPVFSILCVTEADNTNGDVLTQRLGEEIDFSKTDEGEMDIFYEFIRTYPLKADRVNLQTNESISNRMINGDCSLLLFDRESVEYFANHEGVYVDLTEYAKKYNIASEELIMSPDGKMVLAISAIDNSFLTSCQIKCSDLYLAIRVPMDGDVEKYSNAKASLEYILSNK